MMEALRKAKEALGNSTSTDEGEDDDGPGSAPDTFTPPPSMDSGGGAAVLEPPSPSTPTELTEPAPGASDEDVERLKRMFGSPDEK